MAACGADPTSPTSPAETFLSFVSAPGDYIGAGQSRRFSAENSTISARALIGNRMVNVDVVAGNSRWTLYLAAPEGQQVRPGTYDRASRWPPPSEGRLLPALSFSGESRGCNTLTGRFVVHEAVFGPDGSVERFHALFEQHCEGASPMLSGEVRIVTSSR
jgi:hypothetical protein